jgi:flagellum-specific peptidoglycan hydrolase FlgJ
MYIQNNPFANNSAILYWYSSDCITQNHLMNHSFVQKSVRSILTILFCFCLATQVSAKDFVRKYIEQYKPLVAQLSEEYGIPASVITAIAIVESGAGKSRNCQLLNNHFGMIGKNNLRKTKGIKSKFKQYNSAEESFRDFCEMEKHKKYYPKLKGTVNYMPWLDAMARSGYSTQPAVWKKMISGAIKQYKLDEAKK